MKNLLLIIILLPAISLADIYKCKGKNGKLSFSDKPCPETSTQEKIQVQDKSQAGTESRPWIKRLRNEKPPGIQITNITESEDAVTIKYRYSSGHNEFIGQIRKLSNLGVHVPRITFPVKKGDMGEATAVVSDSNKRRWDKQNK